MQIENIKKALIGLITDIYFNRSLVSSQVNNLNPHVKYTVFIRYKEPFVFAGEDYVKSLIGKFGGEVEMFVSDGDIVYGDSVTLFNYEGEYQKLVELETELLGDLSTLCQAATAMRKVVAAADKTPVLYFGARHRTTGWNDYLWCLGALIGGARDIASHPTAELLGREAVGTMPHAQCLVAGSTLNVAIGFQRAFPKRDLVVLIDTYGKELTDSKELVEYFGTELKGVRIDTHGGRICEGCVLDNTLVNDELGRNLFNKAIQIGLNAPEMNKYVFGKGVTVEAIYRLRQALDECGGSHVKIIASSGFDSVKTKIFRMMQAPIDVLGVGLGNAKTDIFATSDIVEINGKRMHKVGRYLDNFDENGKFKPTPNKWSNKEGEITL